MKRIVGIICATAFTAAAGSNPATELSRRAADLYRQARYAEAEPVLRLAIEAWNLGTPEGARNRVMDERRLGSLLEITGRYAAAEEILTTTLAKLEATGAPANETVCAMSFLSSGSRARRDFAKAESWASRALAYAESHEDVSAAERLSVRLLLGSVYLEELRLDDAERVFLSVMDGGDAPTVMAAYTNLASIAIGRGDLERGEQCARQALQLARLSFPATHPAVATAWNNLAQVLRFRKNYTEAEKAYREAISIWEIALGQTHPDVAKGLMNLAGMYRESGRLAEAEVAFRRVEGIRGGTLATMGTVPTSPH
jgi:tetratricopeptide (TPR) repeat protein